MTGDSMHDRICDNICQAEHVRRRVRRRQFLTMLISGENVATLMIGVVSVTLGVVGMRVMIAGLAGVAIGGWSDEYPVTTKTVPPRYVPFFDPSSGKSVKVVQRVLVTTVFQPSRYCASVCLLGLVIGLAGVGLACLRRKFSLLCALGILLCFLALLGGPAGIAFLELIH